jgi:nicotinamide-nucleotide amidase
MQNLLPQADKIAANLKDRRETIAIAESSTGGLISSALLSVAGASVYFLGGAVVYTLKARRSLLDIQDDAVKGMRGASEPYALLLARTARERFGSTWALSETGATGPTGNRYGDAPGHTCIAISGPVERAITIETGVSDRVANMRAFAAAALDLLAQSIAATPKSS